MDRTGGMTREQQLLVTGILLFTLFAHWGGTNAWSRYDLTAAMVEQGQLDIRDYAHNTGDKRAMADLLAATNLTWEDVSGDDVRRISRRVGRAKLSLFRNGSVPIYSDKAPMSSVLGIPGYLLGSGIGRLLALPSTDRWTESGLIDVPVSLSMTTLLQQILITLTVPVVAGAFLLVMLFRSAGRVVDERTALYTALIGGTATPLFYYSTALWGVASATALGFLAFVILHRDREDIGHRTPYLAGLAAGLATATTYYAGVVPLILSAYLLVRGRHRDTGRLVAGAVAGATPMLLYNLLVTGSPFIPPFFTGVSLGSGCVKYLACHQDTILLSYFVLDPARILMAMARLLFYPVRGLLFYSPVLLLAIPGARRIYNQDRVLLLPLLGIPFLLLLFQASVLNWIAGGSFGPRYMVPGIPFLLLLVAVGLQEARERRDGLTVLAGVTVLVSLFNALLGFVTSPRPVWTPAGYAERFYGLAPIDPGYYPRMVDHLLRQGAASPLLRSLLGIDRGFDLASTAPPLLELGVAEGFVLLRTEYLAVMLALVVGAGLWGRLRAGEIPLRRILLPAAGIIFVVSIFHAPVYPSEGRWMAQLDAVGLDDGSAGLRFHARNGSVAPTFTVSDSLNGSSGLDISVNGRDVGRFYHANVVIPASAVRPGPNTIRFSSPSCPSPDRSRTGTDGCPQHRIRDFELRPLRGVRDVVLLDGWYPWGTVPDGGRLMRREASIRTEMSTNILKLRLDPVGSSRDNLSVTADGTHIGTYHVDGETTVYLPPADGNATVFRLRGERDCHRADGRCASFRLTEQTAVGRTPLQDITTRASPQGLPSLLTSRAILANGWDDRNLTGEWGDVYVEAIADNHTITLDLSPAAPTALTVAVNGKATHRLRELRDRRRLLIDEGIQDGLNRIQFHRNCTRGCPPIRTAITVVDPRQRIRPMFTGRWYGIEGDGGRWMRRGAAIHLNGGDGKRMVEFGLRGFGDGGISRGLIRFNGTVRDVRRLGDGRANIGLRLPADTVSTITFESPDGCAVPEQVTGTADTRCLSLRLQYLVVRRLTGDGITQRVFELPSGAGRRGWVTHHGWSWQGGDRTTRDRAMVSFAPWRRGDRPRLVLAPVGNVTDLEVTRDGQTVYDGALTGPTPVLPEGPLDDGLTTVRIDPGCDGDCGVRLIRSRIIPP